MIDEQEIRKVLREVKHPELGRGLMELGMIRDLRVDVKKVRFTVVLPFMDAPIKYQIVREVRDVVEKQSGVQQVTVDLAGMTQKERARFMSAQHEGSAQRLNRVSHVIAILSGKGGVGKSTVAGLLAVVLRREGYQVGILDADITGPSIPKMFFPSLTLPLNGPTGILPVETQTGIKVMSINLLLPKEDTAVIWRGPLIGRTIQQFWDDVIWGELDYLIVDLPPGTGDASLTVMQSIPLDGVVLVTIPQALAGMVVRKAAEMTQKMGAPILGLVENMSYIICPKCGERIELFGASKTSDTARRLNVPVLGRLPVDPQLTMLCDAGRIEEYSSDAFAPIGRELVASVEQEDESK